MTPPLLRDVFADLRYGFRNLLASPGFAAVAVLSLALGIGANTAIFSLIDAVVLKSLPVTRPDELMMVDMPDASASFTNPLWEELRNRQDVFSGIFAYGSGTFNLARGGEEEHIHGYWVSGDYFNTLGVKAVLGRTLTPADDRRGCPGAAVLSHDFWQTRYGGSPDVLDKTITLDGHTFPIVGVTQPGFTGVVVGTRSEVNIPICAEPLIHTDASSLDQRSWWWLRVIARPKPGVGVAQVNARLKMLSPEIFAATVPPRWRGNNRAQYLSRTFAMQPAGQGVSYLRKEYRLALWTLMGMVGLVLLIACANVANLLLARAAARRREMAIRLAIGAGRARLIRQLLTESLMLALSGAALGILFAQWGTSLLVRFLSSSDNPVFLDLTVDVRVLAFTTGVAIVTGILFGLAPAWRGTSVAPQEAMRENSRGVIGGASRFAIGKVLVMVQVALSTVLLVGAGLMLTTFRTLTNLDTGFDRDHVLLINADFRNSHIAKTEFGATFDQVLDELRALPGVASASQSTLTPVGGSSWNDDVQVEGFVPKKRGDSLVWFNRVGPGYFATMGTPLLAGRDFNAADRTGAPDVALVNAAMAKHFFGDANPVGRYLRVAGVAEAGPPIQVIGVVANSKYGSLREDPQDIAYRPMAQNDSPTPYVSFELRAAGGIPAESLIAGAKTAFAQHHADVNLEFRTLAVQLAESLTRERLLATLSGFFGGLALLLAAIGLYGVMSYSVARRRNEIGIRMALGAQQARVLRMVLNEVILLIGMGVVVGTGVALAATKLIATFLYGLKPRDPSTIVLAVLVLGTVAVLAGFIPARRASRLDPMEALREE